LVAFWRQEIAHTSLELLGRFVIGITENGYAGAGFAGAEGVADNFKANKNAP
jgi:hypothetical protein